MAKPLNLPAAFRQMKEDYRADYAAARPSRFRRVRSHLFGSGDSHYAGEWDFMRLREYGRDMIRNDDVVKTFLERAVDNQVQTGFKPEPETGDRKLDRDLKALWRDWSEGPDQCDVTGEMAFPEIEWHMTFAEYADGDIFALPLEEGCLQLVEANRCRTATNTKLNVVHGVMLSPVRKPLEYWFAPDNLDPFERFERVSDAKRIPARDEDGNKQVFHLYKPNRVSQTRGVLALHPIFDKAGMRDDVDFALLVKQQMAACLMGSWEKTPDYVGSGGDMQTGPRDPVTGGVISPEQKLLEGISPGVITQPPRGVKLNFHTPAIPSTEALEQLRRMTQTIAFNLGMPLAMATLDSKEANFSSLRWVHDQAKIGFRVNQGRRVSRFHRPSWCWKLRQWIATEPPSAPPSKSSASGFSAIDGPPPAGPTSSRSTTPPPTACG